MSSDDAVIEDYDRGDLYGDIFAISGFVFVTLLWLGAIGWTFRVQFDFAKLVSPQNWAYWISMIGTLLGSVAATAKLGTEPDRSLRDFAALLGWALLFSGSVVGLAVSALGL